MFYFQQVKGLTTEHGRFASANATQSQQPAFHESNNLPSPASRRQQRNSLSASLESINRIGGGIVKNEPLPGSGGGGGAGGGGSGATTPNFASYLPPTYIPPSYETSRKRSIRSPFYEEATRGSVLRDGKASVGNDSPVSGSKNYRPSSSGSSAAPTEADTAHTDRDSPQQSK